MAKPIEEKRYSIDAAHYDAVKRAFVDNVAISVNRHVGRTYSIAPPKNGRFVIWLWLLPNETPTLEIHGASYAKKT